MSASTIRTRLLLLVVAMSAPLVAVTAYGIYSDLRHSIDHTKSTLQSLARTMINNTGIKLGKTRQTLESLAVRPIVKQVDPKNCDGILKEVKGLNPEFANVTYVDLKGIVVCSAVAQPGGKPVNVGQAPWFQDFLKKRNFSIGQPFLGPITGKWVSVLSVPIWNENKEMVGGVHLPLDLESFDPQIPSQLLPPKSSYGFINQDKIYVWRNVDTEKLVGNKARAVAGEMMVKVRNGEFEAIAIDGVSRFYSVASMPETGWIAYVGIPTSDIYAEARQHALTSIAIALLATVLLLAFVVAMTRKIVQPIAALEQAARAVRNGDSNVRLEITGPREIAEVAKEFNSMLETQERTATEIRQLNQNLELRVAERTAELEAAKNAALAASQVKSDFLSSMSHELRTPLNAILGFGQMLEMDSASNSNQNESVSYILTAGHQMLGLVNDLLDLARIDSGKLALNVRRVRIANLASSCAEQVRAALATQANITIENRISDTDLAVQGDDLRVRQVLINLLSNAVKYNKPNGSVTIGGVIDKDKGRIRIEVRDTGEGVASDKLPLLFTPFERLEHRAGAISGVGIGLHIAKQLVEAMHGTIGVASILGVGSTFWFELPLADDADEFLAAAQETSQPILHGDARFVVLYIEDNPANLVMIKKALQSRPGIELLAAGTAEDGLTIAEEARPDLILMDIQLPGIDGVTATTILKRTEATRGIPVVALSGAAAQEDINRALNAGCSSYLTKPINLQVLYGLIEGIRTVK